MLNVGFSRIGKYVGNLNLTSYENFELPGRKTRFLRSELSLASRKHKKMLQILLAGNYEHNLK